MDLFDEALENPEARDDEDAPRRGRGGLEEEEAGFDCLDGLRDESESEEEDESSEEEFWR